MTALDFTIVIEVKPSAAKPSFRAYTNEGYAELVANRDISWECLNEIINASGFPRLLNDVATVRRAAQRNLQARIASIERQAETLAQLRAELAELET